MSIFTCCEREDETKYLHTCACPSATFSCESDQISPTLCGLSEYSGFASSPPIKYTRESQTQSLAAWPSYPENGCAAVSSSIYRQLTILSNSCSTSQVTNAPLLVEWEGVRRPKVLSNSRALISPLALLGIILTREMGIVGHQL